jgi:hypothetical protein
MGAENRIGQILASVLDGAAVEVPRAPSHGADLVIRTRDGRQIELDVKWAGEGWPEDIRRVAENIPQPWPQQVVVVARHLSSGAINWLRERDANWADEAGQARILGPAGLLVIRESSTPGPPDAPQRAFSLSASGMSLAETILSREDEPLRTAQLAKLAHWSVAQTSSVLKVFDERRWTVKRGAQRGPAAYRELIDADGMLSGLTVAVAGRARKLRMAHRTTRDVMGLLRDELAPALDENVTWAASGWAGVELTAPLATTTPSLHIYVSQADFAGPLSLAMEQAGLRELDEGGRVSFWRADPRILALASERQELPVVSPPRLYADLSSFGARGQDVADHLKRELIDPLHPTSLLDSSPAASREQNE